MAKSTSTSTNGSGASGAGPLASRDPRAGIAALVPDDWNHVAELLGPLKAAPDALRKFPHEPGSDDEPWDVLLAMLAIDEHTALQRSRSARACAMSPSRCTILRRFYEVVPPEMRRSAPRRGDRESDGRVMVIATAQPMQPATFTMIEDELGMPVRLVLSSRGSVANLINRGYEAEAGPCHRDRRRMPLDERAIASARPARAGPSDRPAAARPADARHPPGEHDPVRGAASPRQRHPRPPAWKRSWSSVSASTACCTTRSARR
jgi:hypothetical protein